MKPIHLIILALTAMTLTVPGQNTINQYEYWFDGNFPARTVVNVTPVSPLQIATGIPTTGLSEGLHSFHIRFRDNNAKFSSAWSQYFQKVPAVIPGGSNVVAYEYWFDNNYAGKVEQSITPQQAIQVVLAIPSISLDEGVHSLHIRFKDDQNIWTSVLSQFFYKIPLSPFTNKNVLAYEYWFDNNHAGKTLQTVTPQSGIQLITNIQASSLTNGLHLFHIRFKDDRNSWSSIQSDFFQKISNPGVISNKIYGYRYWFDSDMASVHSVPVAPPQTPCHLIDSAIIPMIPDGNHTISFQFKDSVGRWSGAITDTFNFTGPMVNRSISSHTIVNGENSCIDALQTLTVGGNGTGFVVQGGGIANMVAGLKIKFLPNTKVQPGGYLHGYISPGSPYCLSPSLAPELKEDANPETVLNKNPSMIIYPNPTNGNFTVQLTGKQEFSTAILKIYTTMGLQILESTIRNGRSTNISLINHSPGIYLVKVVHRNEIFIGKVIRQ